MNQRNTFILITCLLLSPLFGETQVRQMHTLNSGWQFVLNDNEAVSSVNDELAWQKINLPHTWNALDIIDDSLGYHQGIGWYRKTVFIPEAYQAKHLELFFEGTCIAATVYVNGKQAGWHRGGFTGFSVSLDQFVRAGADNEVLVRVDNGKYLRDSVPPYSADFNLMGGIYRDVWLLATNHVHFGSNYSKDGIYFETPLVTTEKAEFTITAFFDENNLPDKGSIEYTLLRQGRQVAKGLSTLAGKVLSINLHGVLAKPALWSPETPELYELRVQLLDIKNVLLDEIVQRVGFKSVAISKDNEFLLNGKPYKLRGASRHQDYKEMGFAMTNAMHVRDIELMKEMGCNFIRIAHYPQDPVIYETCDRLGLLAWNEIPVVDRYVDNPTFSASTADMMQEMILQNFNHPSIAIWGYHNEVRNLEPATIQNAKMLNSIAKTLDKHRLTAMAFESNIDAPYFSNPLLKEILSIADINGYNVYQGWYRGKHNDIGKFLDTLYAYHPSKPIMLSEYGAGSIINMHSYHPSIFDFSEEYQVDYHQSYVKAGNSKPWMIGFAIWNFIDFQRDGREDVVPNINKKGMVTTDREPKDVFYYYQSQWSKKPFVYIAGKHWPKRIALTGADGKEQIPITVYSNQTSLELLMNGQSLGSKISRNGVFNWQVDIGNGHYEFVCKTTNAAHADILKLDVRTIDTTQFASDLSWTSLHFNTGQTSTFFTDTKSKEQWMPDKPYTPGTWGYVNGNVWKSWPGSAAWDGKREGIHKPIANTDNEPLFQTFVQGLTAWKADVPDGQYMVSVLLCEPFTRQQRSNEDRVVDISINQQLWQQQLNIEKVYGIQAAVLLDKIVTAKSGKGIMIELNASSGKTILNGVSIRRL